MTSSDRDQTSFDRYGRTVRRAYTPFSLSADQRQRHHALLDEAARRRATGRLRPHLAEAAAIATIALLVVIALVTWRALQPANDERAGAPPGTTKPAVTSSPELASHINYMFRDGDVVGIDSKTGEEVQHIDVNTGTPSPFLAVSYESGRIAVGDLLHLQTGGAQPGSSADAEYGIKVYRMSDGSLEQQIPAAGLATCREACEGVIFSQDGQRLHVYQRNWPGGADASSIRYLLTTYDLESGEWLDDVDLGTCGLVNTWGFVADHILRIECSDSGPVEIDTSTFARHVAAPLEILAHERMYTVDAAGRISATNLGTGESLFEVEGGTDTDIALSTDGATIYWIGAESLVAADAITGAETWRVTVSYEERTRWIMGLGPSTLAISPDGERLYLSATDPEEMHRYTVRIYDTQSGEVIGETNPFEVKLVGTNGVESTSLCGPHLFPSPSGDRLLTPCSGRFNFYLFDTDSGEILQKAGLPAAGSVASSVASPDGSLAYIVTSNGFVAVMHTQTAELIGSAELFSAVQPARLALALSPDGSQLYVPVSYHGEPYGTSDIYVYDTETWEELDRISLDFFMDGQALSVDSAGNIYSVRTIDNQGSALWRWDAGTAEVMTQLVASAEIQHILIYSHPTPR